MAIYWLQCVAPFTCGKVWPHLLAAKCGPIYLRQSQTHLLAAKSRTIYLRQSSQISFTCGRVKEIIYLLESVHLLAPE